MDVYQRISDELNERKHLTLKEEESINQGFVKVVRNESRRTMSTSDLPSESDDCLPKDRSFLKHKHSLAIQVEIPSFFNDKKQKTETREAKKEEPEKPGEKKCLTGKEKINLDFGKGLFDEKLDFDPSDDMDSFKVVKKKDFDQKLREVEIKSAIFNTISEDLFFSLD